MQDRVFGGLDTVGQAGAARGQLEGLGTAVRISLEVIRRAVHYPPDRRNTIPVRRLRVPVGPRRQSRVYALQILVEYVGVLSL